MEMSNLLITATLSNNPTEIKTLLQLGCHPHIACDQSGVTALHHAAQNDYLEIAGLLLQHGADPFCCTDDGITPYSVGSLHESHRILKLFNHHLSVRGFH